MSSIKSDEYLEAERLFDEAEKAIAQKDLPSAEKLLRSVIEKNPNFSYAYQLVAEIVAGKERYTEAIRILDMCTKSDTGFAHAQYLTAKYRFRLGNHTAASTLLAKARALKPDSRLYALAEKQLKAHIKPEN